MKKKFLLGIVCLAAGAQNFAQQPGTMTDKHEIVAPVPPPPPPPPPAPPPAPVPDGSLIDPPSAPIPPLPPVPENYIGLNEDNSIISDSGFQISVKSRNGNTLIYARKNGKTEKIKMSTWNANRKYYEKKYGKLPPPPPPPPPPAQ
mgnify:CR=1 FL=1